MWLNLHYQIKIVHYNSKLVYVIAMVTTRETTYRIYTMGNEKGIKAYHYKKMNKIQKIVTIKVKMGENAKRHTESNEQNGSSKSFPISNYFNCKY